MLMLMGSMLSWTETVFRSKFQQDINAYTSIMKYLLNALLKIE